MAQSSYWQQQLRYDIKAELNDREKSITGTEQIVYKNNSPSTLDFIWFHIWPNAYQHDSTALMVQIRNDEDRKKKSEKFGAGSITGLSFQVNGEPARTEPHSNPQYIDIIKLILNQPLSPGDSITIATPFKVMLPPYFSRSGHADGEFMACQWYPKPAVFDKNGWHEFPYLDMGEFYSEYADYSVSLTVPAGYVVGATGTLLTKDELELYKKIGSKNVASKKGKRQLYTPLGASPTKTLQYFAKQVPDFAWFADKGFVIQYDTVNLPGGKVIDAFTYYHDKKSTVWNNSISYSKDAVKSYSKWIGDYDYPVVQVVEGPENNSSGGMEYPMITLITQPDANEESLDGVITHEIGHNWFMSMLGSNERAHTWMDEGLNTYFQFRYEAEKFRGNSVFGKSIPKPIRALPADKFQSVVYQTIDKNVPMPSPMDMPADKYPSAMAYGMSSYLKPALWLYGLESSVGRDKLDLAVRTYFKNWKHRHPQPEDMQKSFEEALGMDLSYFFALTKKSGKLKD